MLTFIHNPTVCQNRDDLAYEVEIHNFVNRRYMKAFTFTDVAISKLPPGGLWGLLMATSVNLLGFKIPLHD